MTNPNQKHTVSTDALDTLGTIIDETAGRDAIHLAVEPCVAGEKLLASDNIGRDADGRWTRRKRSEAIGIVDPFLEVPVKEGQMFWLVVYPRTITSLRHVWSHPNFDDAPTPVISKRDEEVKEAKKKISNYLKGEGINTYTYGYDDEDELTVDAFIRNAILAGEIGDSRIYMSTEAYGEIPREILDLVEIVAGKKLNFPSDTYFSCAC